MHNEVLLEFKKWCVEIKETLNHADIAELGSHDLNGNIKGIVSNSVGFDLNEGPNVDVVIEPGVIPEDHVGKYNIVVSISSFQFCPYPEQYKKEILDLLCADGLLFLTMCSPSCKLGHTTSFSKHEFTDSFRMTHDELRNLFSDDFEILELYDTEKKHTLSHNDTILKAKKK
jgi:hypothetical protein